MELKSIRNEDGSFVRYFTANGRRYTIRKPEEGVGIFRHTKMNQMAAVTGMGATFADLYRNLKQAVDLANTLVTKTPQFTQLAVLLDNMLRGVFEGSKMRYTFALQYCTFFIVWHDEDLTQYDEEEQQKKIDDWNKEGLNEQDFLALGLSMVEGYTAAYLEYSGRIEALKVVYSSDTTGSTQMAR